MSWFKMKKVLMLIFCMAGPIASTTKFFESVPPNPWFFTTQIRPMRITKFPRFTTKDLPKLILWKHLLELECLKDICSEGRSTDRSGHTRPSEVTARAQVPAFRKEKVIHQDQRSNSYEIKGSRFRPGPQTNRYSGNERVIYWTPEMAFPKSHVKVFPAKQELEPRKNPEMEFKGSPQGGTVAVNDHMSLEQDSKASVSVQGRTMEGKDVANPSGAFPEEEDQRKKGPGADALSKLFQRPILVKPTSATHSENTPQSFQQKMSTNRIHPYEVEEIIEEKFLVDVDDNSDDGNFKTFSGKNLILNNAVTKTETNKKTEHFQRIIDDSVNTILKGLMGPTGKNVDNRTAPPEINNSSTAVDAFKMFTSHLSSQRATENIIGSPWNFQQASKREKIHPTSNPSERSHGWRHKSAEAAQKFATKLFKPDARVDGSRGFDLNPSFENEYLSFLTTGPPRRPLLTETNQQPLNIFNIEKFESDLAKGAAKKPVPESSSAAGTLKSLALLRNLVGEPWKSFPPTEKKNGNSITEMAANSTDLPIHSLPPLETSSAVQFLPTESTTADSSDTVYNEADAPMTPRDSVQTFGYSSDGDRSDGENPATGAESASLEFSDRPLLFDLLTTTVRLESKKDQEIIWKNSRRMHFGHEPLGTTVHNGISRIGDIGDQRRSDILITDNIADYVDDEIVPTLTYLEKLKQNNSFLPYDTRNSTSDELISLIPVIINDLREGKIPSEDISILSGALGKYWNPVLTLSNFTNLDMLPLINVKDEKDLENVLQNYVSEEKTSTPAGTTESEYRIDDYYNHSYDYMDEYKDLYKDILGQELGDKKKRYRHKRDAEDDLKTLEATREYFESIEEERNDDAENDYVFEDLMYDEITEGEDSSVFELMEVSDVHINKET